MITPITFRWAIKRLANNDFGSATTREGAIRIIYNEVDSICTTPTDGGDGRETPLWDWLYMRDYSVNETPHSLAIEWDELSEEPC